MFWIIHYFSKNYLKNEFCIDPNKLNYQFSTLQESEVWGFDAPVIATDLQTASTLINTTGPTKKYFYVWDLEWMRMGGFKHKTLSKIYNNESLELIARSKRHAKIIEQCWRKPSHVMNDFSSTELLEIIKKWHT